MSLPPRRDLDAKGLEAFRALSARYKGMAEGRGHQFVDVEQVLWPETAVSNQPAPASQTAAALAPAGMWESDQVHLGTNAMIKIWRAVYECLQNNNYLSWMACGFKYSPIQRKSTYCSLFSLHTRSHQNIGMRHVTEAPYLTRLVQEFIQLCIYIYIYI